MEQILLLIVFGALSMISNYLNKKAEKEQQEEEAKRLHERAARQSQRQREVSTEPENQSTARSRQETPDSDEEPSPIRKFWEELNEATREFTEPFEPKQRKVERQGPNLPPSPPTEVAQTIQVDASDTAQQELEAARERKKKAAEELRKKKKKAPNPWAYKTRRTSPKGATARTWLKSPATARQAFAASILLAPPKSLKEEEDQWFSR